MKNRPLEVVVSEGELIIRIGVDVLKFAAEHGSMETYDHVSGAYTSPKIYSSHHLAKDVAACLQREDEDGTTAVHLLLYAAMAAAYELGSEAFAENVL